MRNTHKEKETNNNLKSLYHSISTRVLIITITLSAITIAFVIGIAVFQHYQATKAYQQLSDDLLIQGLRQQLTYFNSKATQQSLESFNKTLNYQKIAAYDKYNTPRGSVGSISDDRPADDKIELYNDKQTVIGTLYIWKKSQPLIGGAIFPILFIFFIGLVIIFLVSNYLVRNVIKTYATNPINQLTLSLDNDTGSFDSSSLPKSVRDIAELNELSTAFATIWQQRDQEVFEKEKAIERLRRTAEERKQGHELLESILISAKISLGYSNNHHNYSDTEIVGFKANKKIENILKQSNYNFNHVLGILKENAIEHSIVRELLDSDDKTKISYIVEAWTDSVTVWQLSCISISENSQALLAAEITDLRMAEQQLFHHQKMDAIGELSSGIAHDFNNVLAIIVSCIESSQLLGESQRNANLSLALQAADRASGLVKHLLNYANKDRREISEINIEETLNNIANLAPLTLGMNHHLNVKTNISPIIQCDADLLEATLINLIINARDAMPDGGEINLICRQAIKQEIKQANLIHSRRYITISVIDNGLGVAANIEAKLFDPFFTTKRRGEGTGMGLSVAYGFAKRSGGAIFLDKNTKKGSQFNLLLPIYSNSSTKDISAKLNPSPQQQNSNSVTTANNIDQLQLQGVSIAVIDDETLLADMLAEYVQQLGMEATVFYTAESINTQLNSGKYKPNIILSDLHLNDGTGYDIYSCMQDNQLEASVVFMSGHKQLHANDSNRHENIPFLQKPFTNKELKNILTEQVRAAL